MSTNQQMLHKELDYIKKALQACHFPPWILNKLQHKFKCKHNTNNGPNTYDNSLTNTNKNNSGTNNSNNKNISKVAPYIQGLGERFKRECNNNGIQVHFKGNNTRDITHGTQGQGQQTLKEWGNLQIQMSPYKLP